MGGSGISADIEPVYIGKCMACGEPIYEHESHYDVPGEGLFCCMDCLEEYRDDYWVAGVIG